MEIRARELSDVSIRSHQAYARWVIAVIAFVLCAGWIGAEVLGRYVEKDRGRNLLWLTERVEDSIDLNEVLNRVIDGGFYCPTVMLRDPWGMAVQLAKRKVPMI